MAESGAPAFSEQVERALTLVALESPIHFAALRRQLGRLTAVIRIGDDPPMCVCVADGPPWVGPSAVGEIELALSKADLSRLLLGTMTVEEGILSGCLSARGTVDHLLALLDGLTCWLHGALRCPSLPQLHQQFFAARTNASHGDALKQKGPRLC